MGIVAITRFYKNRNSDVQLERSEVSDSCSELTILTNG